MLFREYDGLTERSWYHRQEGFGVKQYSFSLSSLMTKGKFCGFQLIRPISWLRYHVKFHTSLPLEAKWK
jgi:hypothetical protein